VVHFTAPYRDLEHDFEQRGIPTGTPGFCDDPSFLAAERLDPTFLNNYAAFVARRSYEPAYLDRARTSISNAAELLYQVLLRHGRLGACVDISGILSRILDREGIWNCPIKGSLTIDFPTESGLETTYFWSVDHGNFVAAHAWIFAPPLIVVDVAIKRQPYSRAKLPYLPESVLSEDRHSVAVDLDDIVSSSAQAEMLKHGVPPERQLDFSAPQLADMLKVFPAVSVPGVRGSRLKYCPVAVGMPDAPLEQMRNMDFDGKTPWKLYNEVFRGKLHGDA